MKNNQKEKAKKIANGDRRAYRIVTTIDQDPYREECWARKGRRGYESKEGSKNYFSWKRKEIYKFQYRAYRTWKYNRKTQWKMKTNNNNTLLE